MRARRLEADGTKGWVLVLDIGDEVVGVLEHFAREAGIEGAYFSGIGALERAVLGYWDWESRDYERIAVDEQVEVLVLSGNVARAPKEGIKIHAHIVVGTRDGSARGGHLLEGHVRPTLEVVVTETPEPLRRVSDARTGLALLSP